MRVLEFNYIALVSLHIGDMLLTIFGTMNEFLPFLGEVTLPRAVPFSFVFPPRIAFSYFVMGPVFNFYVATLGDNGTVAARACATEAGFSFSKLIVYQCILHGVLPALEKSEESTSAKLSKSEAKLLTSSVEM